MADELVEARRSILDLQEEMRQLRISHAQEAHAWQTERKGLVDALSKAREEIEHTIMEMQAMKDYAQYQARWKVLARALLEEYVKMFALAGGFPSPEALFALDEDYRDFLGEHPKKETASSG